MNLGIEFYMHNTNGKPNIENYEKLNFILACQSDTESQY